MKLLLFGKKLVENIYQFLSKLFKIKLYLFLFALLKNDVL